MANQLILTETTLAWNFQIKFWYKAVVKQSKRGVLVNKSHNIYWTREYVYVIGKLGVDKVSFWVIVCNYAHTEKLASTIK